ncbi:hypothetical protein E2542_SST10393 [Spatholobus suberectus]|nr:hypothetical protein E2542_SST10393 [Spatholobus suberectus]
MFRIVLAVSNSQLTPATFMTLGRVAGHSTNHISKRRHGNPFSSPTRPAVSRGLHCGMCHGMANASPHARWKIVTLPGQMLKSKGWQKLNSLALDRSVILINGRLQDMARLMGPAKTLFWQLPLSPGNNIRPKDLFLTMVNPTMPEANSCGQFLHNIGNGTYDARV